MGTQNQNGSLLLGDEVVLLDEVYARPVGTGRIEGKWIYDGPKFNIRMDRDARLLQAIGIERVRSADE